MTCFLLAGTQVDTVELHDGGEMEDVYSWLISRPGLIYNTGNCMWSAGFALLLSGLFNLLMKAAISPFSSPHAGQENGIAAIFPSIPTWWIPETAFGFGFALLLIVLGVLLALEGKKLKRVMDYYG